MYAAGHATGIFNPSMFEYFTPRCRVDMANWFSSVAKYAFFLLFSSTKIYSLSISI